MLMRARGEPAHPRSKQSSSRSARGIRIFAHPYFSLTAMAVPMYRHQNRWYSSFLSMNDHVQGISDAVQVLTVRSGSVGTGGHVTMYLETTEPLVPGGVSTRKLELTAVEGLAQPIIALNHVQLSNAHGELVIDNLDSKRGPAELLRTHHKCYKITAAQSADVLTAARRFEEKVNSGRYIYHQQGGIKARLGSWPGTRGVNCADFVIKILREAGIANLGYKWVSTPFRVALA